MSQAVALAATCGKNAVSHLLSTSASSSANSISVLPLNSIYAIDTFGEFDNCAAHAHAHHYSYLCV